MNKKVPEELTHSQSSAERQQKKPYVPPAISFIEEMEVVAGLCAKADGSCGTSMS